MAAFHEASKQSSKPKPEPEPMHAHDVYEWREGPHLVIERRRSDGDVEVEVVPNAYRDEAAVSARFAGARDRVMHDVKAHLESLGHKVEGALGHSPHAHRASS